MAMSAEQRSKFAALHRQWWRIHMSEQFSSETIISNQPNKQTNNLNKLCFESRLTNYAKWQKYFNDTIFKSCSCLHNSGLMDLFRIYVLEKKRLSLLYIFCFKNFKIFSRFILWIYSRNTHKLYYNIIMKKNHTAGFCVGTLSLSLSLYLSLSLSRYRERVKEREKEYIYIYLKRERDTNTR